MEFIQKKYDSPQYVPKDNGEWKDERSYQVNDYVLYDKDGYFYKAIKDAPAGSGAPDVTKEIWERIEVEPPVVRREVDEIVKDQLREMNYVNFIFYDDTDDDVFSYFSGPDYYACSIGSSENINDLINQINAFIAERVILPRKVGKILLVFGKNLAATGEYDCASLFSDLTAYANLGVYLYPTTDNLALNDNQKALLYKASVSAVNVDTRSLIASCFHLHNEGRYTTDFGKDLLDIVIGIPIVFRTPVTTSSFYLTFFEGELSLSDINCAHLKMELSHTFTQETIGEIEQNFDINDANQIGVSYADIVKDRKIIGYATSSTDAGITERVIATANPSGTSNDTIYAQEFWSGDLNGKSMVLYVSVDFDPQISIA